MTRQSGAGSGIMRDPHPDNLTASLILQANPGAAARADASMISDALGRVIESGRFIMGDEGASFEREFASWTGADHAVACANGTDALVLSLLACGIGPDMAVAMPSHTAVATAAAVCLTGAVPFLLDIEPQFYTLDPAELEVALGSPRNGLFPIRAVIPVHLYGQPVDLPSILAICNRLGVAVIEDCSQAHGATASVKQGLQKVGTFGHAAAFSFYPTKNLAALGDGGLVTTNIGSIARQIECLRQYGWDANRVSQEAGRNSRLDELQAAILRGRLPLLDAANRRRNTIAAAFDDALLGTDIAPPSRRPGCTHVFHQYVVRSPNRASLQARLKARGIATAVHYAPPIHQHPAFAAFSRGPADCRATESAAAEIVSLPIYPELTDAELARICEALREL